MKVTLRTVSGESFHLEVEESLTVADLKDKVAEARSIPLSSLKLVYKGKVLDNATATMAECGVTEAGFIVVFVQAAKAAAPAVRDAVAILLR